MDASGGGVQAGGLVDGKRVLAVEEEAKEYESYSFDSGGLFGFAAKSFARWPAQRCALSRLALR